MARMTPRWHRWSRRPISRAATGSMAQAAQRLSRQKFATVPILEKRTGLWVRVCRTTPLSGEPLQATELRTSLMAGARGLTPKRQKVLAPRSNASAKVDSDAEGGAPGLLGADRESVRYGLSHPRLLSAMSVRELELPEGGVAFELFSDTHRDHHHLVCIGCGRTEEFESAPGAYRRRAGRQRPGIFA